MMHPPPVSRRHTVSSRIGVVDESEWGQAHYAKQARTDMWSPCSEDIRTGYQADRGPEACRSRGGGGPRARRRVTVPAVNRIRHSLLRLRLRLFPRLTPPTRAPARRPPRQSRRAATSKLASRGRIGLPRCAGSAARAGPSDGSPLAELFGRALTMHSGFQWSNFHGRLFVGMKDKPRRIYLNVEPERLAGSG